MFHLKDLKRGVFCTCTRHGKIESHVCSATATTQSPSAQDQSHLMVRRHARSVFV